MCTPSLDPCKEGWKKEYVETARRLSLERVGRRKNGSAATPCTTLHPSTYWRDVAIKLDKAGPPSFYEGGAESVQVKWDEASSGPPPILYRSPSGAQGSTAPVVCGGWWHMAPAPAPTFRACLEN